MLLTGDALAKCLNGSPSVRPSVYRVSDGINPSRYYEYEDEAFAAQKAMERTTGNRTHVFYAGTARTAGIHRPHL